MKWEYYVAQTGLDRRTAELDIYDVIGDSWTGTSSQQILWSLRAMDVDEIVVRINSLGGVVSEGFDIYNLLREHKAKVVCRISGIAASIASIVALAGDTVEMYANSQYMIHDPYAQFDYGAPPMREADLRRSADLLNTLKSQMYAIYSSKTGLTTEDVAKLCAAETWMSADQAKEKGFIDRVLMGGEHEMQSAKASLSENAWKGFAKREPKFFASFRNLPQSIRIAAQAAEPSSTPSTPTPTLTPKVPKKMARKLNRVALAKATSQGSLSSILVSLSEVLAKAKSKTGSDDFSAEELDELKAALDEATAQAETLEEEAKAGAAHAKEYEETKSALEAANSRAAKAGEELEEVKKKMAELKSAKAGGDEDEGDDGSSDEKMDAGQKVAFASASKGTLRAIARVAMDIVGCYDVKILEGSLVALEGKVASIPSAEKQREMYIDQLVADGKLPPARKAWALKASVDNLNAFLEGKGLTRFSAEIKPGALAAAEHNNNTPGSQIADPVKPPPGNGTGEDEVLPNKLTRREDKLRQNMGHTVEQALAARNVTLASGTAPLSLSF